MSIRLVLVHHGEAVPEETDPLRPLTPTGRADIESLGEFLASSGVEIPRIIHSGKLRATDSAEILAEKLGGSVPVEAMERISPKDTPVWLTEEVMQWSEGALIVSHTPFLSRFVSRLLFGVEQPYVLQFTPGTAACLARRPASKAWTLDWILRPALLRR